LTPAAQQQLQEQIQAKTGIQAELGALLTEIRHGVTRFRIHLLCFEGRYLAGSPNEEDTIRWVSPCEFADYPLSTTGRKFADLLARAG
jgi:A/G-specific adenine glycosylase